MNLEIVTIVLDGMPWIERHLSEFQKLSQYDITWNWNIIEGASMNRGSTKWCRPQTPRLSNDGTNQYLRKINLIPHVHVTSFDCWNSKDAMVNLPLSAIDKPCVLMQIDSDEMWTAAKLAKVVWLFTTYPQRNRAYFWCNYFVGPDLITITPDSYGNKPGEWLRAWRFKPGMKFDSHEPPVLEGNQGESFSRDETRRHGLVFDHMSYATEKQVAYKERFYGYRNAVIQWRLLQANKQWPAQLRKFLPWVDHKCIVDKLPVDSPRPR